MSYLSKLTLPVVDPVTDALSIQSYDLRSRNTTGLGQVLTAGQTTISFTNVTTKNTDIVQFGTSVNGLEYNSLVMENVTESGNIVIADYVLTFDAQPINVWVSMLVVDTYLPVNALAVTTMPTKTSYLVGELLNTTGIVVEATVADFTSDVTHDCVFTPLQMTTAGTQSIQVTYEEGITFFDVTVDVATGISITTLPTKTSYMRYDYLDTTGLVITATDGSSYFDITSSCKFSPTILDKAGSQEIVVTFGTLTTKFNVTVEDVTGIAVTNPPDKTTFIVNDEFRTDGMVVTASSANMTKDITEECYTIPTDTQILSAVGDFNAVIHWQEFQTTQPYSVVSGG